MKPSELYEMPLQYVEKGIGLLHGFYFNHIEEAAENFYSVEDFGVFKDIEVRIVKEFIFDDRRFWRLATVWYRNESVMVIQNAGREGDDHHKRFITDSTKFKEMIKYIRSLIPIEENTIVEFSKDQDIEKLDDFYGNHLNGYFERY